MHSHHQAIKCKIFNIQNMLKPFAILKNQDRYCVIKP